MYSYKPVNNRNETCRCANTSSGMPYIYMSSIKITVDRLNNSVKIMIFLTESDALLNQNKCTLIFDSLLKLHKHCTTE